MNLQTYHFFRKDTMEFLESRVAGATSHLIAQNLATKLGFAVTYVAASQFGSAYPQALTPKDRYRVASSASNTTFEDVLRLRGGDTPDYLLETPIVAESPIEDVLEIMIAYYSGNCNCNYLILTPEEWKSVREGLICWFLS